MSGQFASPGNRAELEEGRMLTPKFDEKGLVTVVTSEARTGELLMLAHMNDEALEKTLDTGEAWYWSRSRGELWHKGATSGAIQKVTEIRVDCDQDAIWLKVETAKAEDTCHTGRATCFYRAVEKDASGKTVLRHLPVAERNRN